MSTQQYHRRGCSRRITKVDWQHLPEWLKLAVSGSLSALGTVVVGLFVAKSHNKRTRADDRSQFTAQMMERLNHVELQLAAALQSLAMERQYCDERMDAYRHEAEEKLKERDEIIAKLRAENENSQQRFDEAMARIDHLEEIVMIVPGGKQ